MLMQKDLATLLVVDVQEKLLPAMVHRDILPARLEWLVGAAVDVGLPVVFSEQYPKGLGHTLPALLARAPQAPVVEKLHFSCVAANCLPESLLMRPHVIVCGVETHVCVLQTVLGLCEREKAVFVVADAVDSRKISDRDAALQRMRDAGAVIVTREMVIFEALREAGTDVFKVVSRKYFSGEQSV